MTLTKKQIIEHIYLRYCGCLPELDTADYDMLDEAYDYGYKAGYTAGKQAGETATHSPAEQINDCDYLRSIYGEQEDS